MSKADGEVTKQNKEQGNITMSNADGEVTKKDKEQRKILK